MAINIASKSVTRERSRDVVVGRRPGLLTVVFTLCHGGFGRLLFNGSNGPFLRFGTFLAQTRLRPTAS